eukprot:Gb_35986 [translate_table: standard]
MYSISASSASTAGTLLSCSFNGKLVSFHCSFSSIFSCSFSYTFLRSSYNTTFASFARLCSFQLGFFSLNYKQSLKKFRCYPICDKGAPKHASSRVCDWVRGRSSQSSLGNRGEGFEKAMQWPYFGIQDAKWVCLASKNFNSVDFRRMSL